ncbi:hypothetical protein MRS44_001462 [Fusarium solani]|uniref:Uncharacterized protein n=1 Tax=Fusarium solani TaxID=169388 RepID=A0A9P9RBN7_FUSSL|nr:uncharacterized protein B0J15DRAFT_413894 [Fusarium solani]KAH7273651.1 hypothetical protein B0J15DRAFT_413894 [Fusarium solani]KAJ3471363.1 hypothetical protein MRS44_001462 [Fusarium solani]
MDQANRRQRPSKAGERVFKTKTCNVPSLTELRKSLGYGHRGEERDIAFKRALTAQVETFVSKDNLPGVSFTKWKTPAHQKGLREMTKDFLVIKQKGLEFWPDDPNSSNKRPLEYTRDYDQIHRLLTKVFYRTAREHKRKQCTAPTTQESNQRPKVTSMKQSHSDKNSNEQTSRQAYSDSRGQSADDPIELDIMQPTTNASAPPADVDPFAESARRFTNEHCMPPEVPDGIPPEEEPINQVWDMRDDFLNIQVPRDSNPTSNIPSHATTVEDPYQGPNSPTEDTHVPRHRGKRPAQSYPIQDVRPAKVPRQAQDNIEVDAGSSTRGPSSNNSSANVPSTSNSSSSFAPASAPSQDVPPVDPSSAAPSKKRGYTHHEHTITRASSRLQKQAQHPNFAGEQTVDRAILTSSSEEEQDNDAEHEVQEPPRPTVNVSNGTSRHENPSTTAPRGDATEPAAEKPASKPRKNASRKQASTKKQTSTKKISKPRAPRASAKRGPAQESPAGPSTQRNSMQQQANGSSTSGPGTRQSQTGQPQTEQNQPPRNNTVPSAEEIQVIDSSSFFFFRHDSTEYMAWTPGANASQILFQMSLSEFMQDLGWDNAQTLYMSLDDSANLLADPYGANIKPGDNDMFNKMRRIWVRQMQRCYQRTREPNLEFVLRFKEKQA